MVGVEKQPLVVDGETLEIGRTSRARAALVYQAFCDANEPTTRRRSLKFFEEAARDHRLFDVKIADHIVGGMYFSKPFRDPISGNLSEELGGLFAHPQARGFRIADILVSAGLLARLFNLQNQASVDVVATVLKGNDAPDRVLRRIGFCPDREVKSDPGKHSGEIKHMLRPGDNIIRGFHYTFDPVAIEKLIIDLRGFLRGGGAVGRNGAIVRYIFNRRTLACLRYENLDAMTTIIRLQSKYRAAERETALVAGLGS